MSEKPDKPMSAAQAAMRPAGLKRFYAQASVGEADGGFALLLDGRGARTPAKQPILLPNRALAEAMAREWAEQGETIDPAAMPLTRLVNSALDGVAGMRGETRAEIARYTQSDLLCYRADAPEALVAAETAAFDPILKWAGEALGAHFVVAEGVVHRPQPQAALDAVRAALEGFDEPIALAALHVMTSLTGSVLLALAVARQHVSAEEAWRIAHVDEDFQISQWGEDAEASARREARRRDSEAAARALALT